MSTRRSSNGEAAAAPTPLPRELIKALPTAAEVVKHLYAIDKMLPQLQHEMMDARADGSIALARSFVVLHRLMSVFNEKVKRYADLFDRFKSIECPAAFEADGVSHVPLAAGYRVTVSYTMRANVVADKKAEAYDWLRANHPDCVIETVNASTLSALARQLMAERNLDLPENLFNTINMPGTSVTRV